MEETCKLKAAVGERACCDEEACVYWRVLGHIGVDAEAEGCAVQHFALLDGGAEVASWLLTVKNRVEGLGDESDVSS